MRIALTLETPRREVRIPLHYHYLLASCIYRTLATSSSRYAEQSSTTRRAGGLRIPP
jgi:CRISPR/Cas system endoribonuclease Cas6 (RAMP superfamily)